MEKDNVEVMKPIKEEDMKPEIYTEDVWVYNVE